MNCLAIDTSTDFLSLALRWQGTCLSVHEPAGQAHAERALPAIQRLLTQQGIQLSQLDAIVFGQGPGSFTGLRIACGLAQGLAFAVDRPVIAIPTLDSMASQVDGQVLVCLDARMQQVYCACYDASTGERLTPISLQNPQDVLLPHSTTPWRGIGSGFRHYPEQLRQRLAPQLQSIDDSIGPHAEQLIKLSDSGRYPALPAREASLLYVRDKVALTASEQQARRP